MPAAARVDRRLRRRLTAYGAPVICSFVLACSGCGASPGTPPQSAGSAAISAGSAGADGQASAGDPSSSGTPSAGASATQHTRPSPSPSRRGRRPLAGKVIGIDPGHNGGNFGDPSYINQLIWNGAEEETCDTTGTQTAVGYTEALFNFNVANYLRADLIKDGAKVVMTRHGNDGVGPCVNRRAKILDAAHVAVAIDIHADGGPSWGRGFTVLEPVADGPNDRVIKSSVRFGADVRAALLKYTTMPKSNYYGNDGLISRDDLAGLNLTTVPKVLVECGNMPNATDARLLTEPAFQRSLAAALTVAIVNFLARR